jgi:acyl carrier protein
MPQDTGTKVNNLEQEIKGLIADIIEMEPAQIDPDAHLVEDLGMDSMMALEILAAIEKKYKIRIPEEDLPKITTVNRAVELASKYVN